MPQTNMWHHSGYMQLLWKVYDTHNFLFHLPAWSGVIMWRDDNNAHCHRSPQEVNHLLVGQRCNSNLADFHQTTSLPQSCLPSVAVWLHLKIKLQKVKIPEYFFSNPWFWLPQGNLCRSFDIVARIYACVLMSQCFICSLSWQKRKIECWDYFPFVGTHFFSLSLFFFFAHSLISIPIVSAISFQEMPVISESLYWCYDYEVMIAIISLIKQNCIGEVSRNAQAESMMLNRPVTVVVGCINSMCS